MCAKKYVFHCAKASWEQINAVQKDFTKTYCVDLIYALFALITLALHPIPIKVREQAVKVIGAGRVSIPLRSVVP